MSETRTITREQLAAALHAEAKREGWREVEVNSDQVADAIFAELDSAESNSPALPVSPSLVSGAAAPDSLDVERLADWQERAIPELVRLVSIVEGWHEQARLITPHGQSGHPARGLLYEIEDGAALGKRR